MSLLRIITSSNSEINILLLKEKLKKTQSTSMIIKSILLGIILVIWIAFAIYLLMDVRKKVRQLGEKFGVFYPFECTVCKQIKNYSYTEYMEIVKKPRKKFSTFITVRNQYLFQCDACGDKKYQEILYEQIPSNPDFVKARRKLILLFFLKEYALGIIVTAIVGLSGLMK